MGYFRNGYIGSVRFFKNLILLAVIILITVPTVLAIRWGTALSGAEDTSARLADAEGQLSALTGQLEQNQASLDAARSELDQALGELDQVRGSLARTQAELDAWLAAEADPEPAPTASWYSIDPDGPAYQSLYPDFYAPQPLAANEAVDGVIYLTFDDGPSPRTPEILEILAREDIKATFFVVGCDDEQSFQWMRDIVAQGHTLGMHSYSHEFANIYTSVEDFLDDMYQLFLLIQDVTGVTPTLFRFPGGSVNGYNQGIYQEIIAEMLRRGFVPHDWNLSTQDATQYNDPPETLTANAMRSVVDGHRGVLLMHDSYYRVNTVRALPMIIEQLRARGFTFDRLTPETAPILFSYPR